MLLANGPSDLAVVFGAAHGVPAASTDSLWMRCERHSTQVVQTDCFCMAHGRCGFGTAQRIFRVLLLVAIAGGAAAAPRHAPTPAANSTAPATAPAVLRATGHGKPKRHKALPLPLPPPPPAPATAGSKVKDFFIDSAQRLRGGREPPLPANLPPDCRKHPGLCQPTHCDVWRSDIKNRC